MNANLVLQALESCLLLIGLATAWFIFRREYQVDSFRQALFAVRDELFDFAADGNIRFDDPAYVELRHLMNGLLRFGHRVTFWQISLLMLVDKFAGIKNGYSFHARWERHLIRVRSEEVRDRLRDFHSEVAGLVVWQIYRSTCLFWPYLWSIEFRCWIAERATLRGGHLKREVIQKVSARDASKVPTEWIEEQALACAA